MSPIKFLRDILMVSLLLTGCVAAGFTFSHLGKLPLPLTYSGPEARLSRAETAMGATAIETSLGADVDKKELRRLSNEKAAIILDARPKIFFELGHIPSARSLPRDDFESGYRSLERTLSSDRSRPVIVYCSDSGCPDGRRVGEALLKLGYQDVHLFRGGWDAWVGASFPTQHGCACGD